MLPLLLLLTIAQTSSLSEQHRLWLEERVRFIISSNEKKQFLALESTKARDRFIETFWKRRDPTPQTFTNESRAEHQLRLEASDRLFTLTKSRGGRVTDRGRIYQLLGPPQSREDYTRAGNRLYPLELWHYSGMTEPFLPESFYLIFFREGGFGDYRLWSPTADGPQALLRTNEPGRFLFQRGEAYQVLRDIDLELAMAVERLVPGESADLSAFRAESLLTSLMSYADAEERYRDLENRVTAEASLRPLNIAPLAVSLIDSAGIPQVHYALEIPPGDVVWEADGTKLRTSFNFYCSIQDPGGREVDFIQDVIHLESATRATSSLSVQGRLVLIPGRYTLLITLRHPPGRKATALTLPVHVPETDRPIVGDILLARSYLEIQNNELTESYPFQIGRHVVSPSTDRRFPPTEIHAIVQVRRFNRGASFTFRLRDKDRVLWQSEPIDVPPTSGAENIEQAVPLADIPNGTYTLELTYPGGRRATELKVDDRIRLPKVRVLAREGLPAGHGRTRFQRGLLFAQKGAAQKAIKELEKAAQSLPLDLEVHLKLAFLLTATSQHQEVLDVLLPLENRFPKQADLLVFMGFASMNLGRYGDAASYYERALEERSDDKKLLSALEKARALALPR